MVNLPMSGLMTVGFDVCHDAKDKRKSYGALVATMDLKKKVEFFSAVTAHTNGEELSNDLALNMRKALQQFREINNTLPTRICFYRDGVGEGQIEHVLEHEVERLKKDFADIYQTAGIEAGPKFSYIIVNKRINTRLFMNAQNPTPGTIVNDVITLPERYDFFLISQAVRQGTVSPTSYNVIHDSMNLAADKMQLLTYKMTHLYVSTADIPKFSISVVAIASSTSINILYFITFHFVHIPNSIYRTVQLEWHRARPGRLSICTQIGLLSVPVHTRLAEPKTGESPVLLVNASTARRMWHVAMQPAVHHNQY